MRSTPLKAFVFKDIYHEIGMVEALLSDTFIFGEMDWTSPLILECLNKYCKTTLLHYYIFYSLYFVNKESYIQDSDLFVDDPNLSADIESTLVAYDIPHTPYKDFDIDVRGSVEYKQKRDEGGYCDTFRMWFRLHEDNFAALWQAMSDEIFYLLFANRPFLIRFNVAVADFLKTGKVALPSNYLDDKGVLKRQQYIPPWVKKAVYCRDHGRCVICQMDLSNLLSTDRQAHYDHIVPLNLWGINDPCNLQLLCERCNLRKGGNSIVTSSVYPVWWV